MILPIWEVEVAYQAKGTSDNPRMAVCTVNRLAQMVRI
jgi:hypothetical protein